MIYAIAPVKGSFCVKVELLGVVEKGERERGCRMGGGGRGGSRSR